MQRTPRHLDFKAFTFLFVTVLTLSVSISCAKNSAADSNQNSTAALPSVKPGPTPQATSTPAEAGSLAVAPMWESQVKGSQTWSNYAAKVISSSCPAMIDGAKDMAKFCPKYDSLSRDQKINVWVYLVSAIVKFESNFKPTARLREASMSTDSVTGEHVYSEGLMQLSYQDELGYSFCKVFDWPADKHLSPTDPQKTILNPYLNLECGIQILNRQIQRHDEIAIQSGAYWSTLRPGGTKVGLIKALVRGMGICH